MAVAYTKLRHLDGRTWDKPASGFEKNRATYEAAGWREAGAGEAPESAGVRIVSLHNQEKLVSASEFAEVYEPAGWTRVDEGAKASTPGPSASEQAAGEEVAAEKTGPKTEKRG